MLVRTSNWVILAAAGPSLIRSRSRRADKGGALAAAADAAPDDDDDDDDDDPRAALAVPPALAALPSQASASPSRASRRSARRSLLSSSLIVSVSSSRSCANRSSCACSCEKLVSDTRAIAALSAASALFRPVSRRGWIGASRRTKRARARRREDTTNQEPCEQGSYANIRHKTYLR